MAVLDGSSGTIHITNIQNAVSNLAGSSGILNASSAAYLNSTLMSASRYINSLLNAAKSGIKISS